MNPKEKHFAKLADDARAEAKEHAAALEKAAKKSKKKK